MRKLNEGSGRMKMSDRLRAWCHYKRLEKNLDEDTKLFMEDIQNLLDEVDRLRSLFSEEKEDEDDV